MTAPAATLVDSPPASEAIETAPVEELEALARERLREVLARAAELPFYRERFAAAGVDPAQVGDFDELAARVPRFGKREVVARLRSNGGHAIGIEALAPCGTAALVLTSGTLGFPTFASLGWGEFDHGSPLEVLRELRMDGLRPGMRVMCMYPAWHHLSLLDNRALELAGAEVVCPWGTFVPRFAGRALDAIESRRPAYLLTVTSMLHAILDEAQRRGRDPRRTLASVRIAMVVGEPVTAAQRRLLCERLGLEDLFERGGSSDGLWGGADCPAHAGHHIWRDHHHVEVVDPQTGEPLPPGARGSVVVTNLTLDRSLHIRFDTEDLGEVLPGECPCGRTHPRVELYGRLADCVTVSGRLIAPYDVRCAVDSLEPLVGVPLVVPRDRSGHADGLEVFLDGDARAPGLAQAAAGRLREALRVPAEVGWADSLPKRWKARTAVTRPRSGHG